MAKDTCDIVCFDQEKVDCLRAAIKKTNIKKTSQIFKILADTNRLQIAYALTKEAELCVCDTAHIIGSSMAIASHHLRTLKKYGLARFYKQGKRAFYSLDDQHVKELIEIAFEHQAEIELRKKQNSKAAD